MSANLQFIGGQIRAPHTGPVVSVACIWVLWSLIFSESPVLSIFVFVVGLLAVKLLWRAGEPPTLLLLIAIHLAQVSTSLLYANVAGVDVNTTSTYGVDLDYATWIALGAVLCLTLGMSVGQAGAPVWSPARAKLEANAWSPRGAFAFFLVTIAMDLIFTELSKFSESTRQLFIAGSGIQWIGVFVLTYVCLSQRRGLGYVSVAVSIEVVLGSMGFFGEFRHVFFALLVAIAAARPKLRADTIVLAIVAIAIALVLSAFWSAIKKNYRHFLNQNTISQAVNVPVAARLSYLASQVENADTETLRVGFDALWARIAYVEFFGATLRNIPTNVPHEDGAMTIAGLTHILVPRLVWPEKPVLPSDTVVTARYTGLPLTVRADTTISIGYPGEFYIDFGTTGLLVCMGILGFLYGKATRVIQRSFESPLIAYGATISLLMPGFMFETALPKAIGGVMTSFIVLIIMGKTVVPFMEKRLSSNFRFKAKMLHGNGDFREASEF